MTKLKKTPDIRFEGFDGVWEQHGLTEILSPIVGNNTLSRAELNYDGGEVKNIHYGDILIKFGSFVDAINDEIPFISNGSIDDFKNSLLKDGDVIFADTAEDETTGKVVEITNATEVNIVSGLHTIVYRPKMKFADCFMVYYLNSNAYRQQLLPLMQGAKVLSLGRSHLATTMVNFPVSLNEQAIISNFFRNLDDTIALKKQQHEKTLNIKKAMLEKMFPKKGADVPEIRFEGFTGAWYYRILGELCLIGDIDHWMPKSVEYGIPYIMTGDFIGINELDLKNAKKVSQEDYEQLSRKIKPEAGDVLFARYASIGTVRMVKTQREFLVSYSCAIVKPVRLIDGEYLFYCFQSETTKCQMELAINTGSQGNIGIDSLKKFGVQMPDKKEQTAIGTFFRNLDNLIEAQWEEIKKLQSIKKACLNKMFV